MIYLTRLKPHAIVSFIYYLPNDRGPVISPPATSPPGHEPAGHEPAGHEPEIESLHQDPGIATLVPGM